MTFEQARSELETVAAEFFAMTGRNDTAEMTSPTGIALFQRYRAAGDAYHAICRELERQQ